MSQSRPNILLVVTDQLVPFVTGPYGHPVVRTPALDALAGTAVRYDAAYTPYPLCAPARAAFMTGKYASSFGCYDNAAPLPVDQPTLAHYLTLAGYETVLSGKMHFVGPDQLHGYRHRLTTDIYPAQMDWVPLEEDGKFVAGGHAHGYVPPKVGPVPWTKFLSYDEEVQYRAVDWLRERGRVGSDEPFFLTVSYHHPHDPFLVTQELWDLYEGAEIEVPGWPDDLDDRYSAMDRWANEAHATDEVPALDDPEALRALRRSYYGLVTYVDRKLGELVETLERSGLREDTLVLLTSDHGDMLAEKRMVQKRTFYEWSARVPLLVELPDRRARAVAEPVSLLDLLPTLLDLAGFPEEERLPVDGRSLLGEPAPFVLSEYHVEKVRAPCFMARKGRWKYVLVHGHGEQLFDLEADPGEWESLAGRPEVREVQEELRGLVLAQFDPEAIDADGRESVRRRDLVRRAMARNGTTWDYAPPYDAGAPRYVR